MEPTAKRPGGWVRLNVGGRIFSTTRATLCRVPDSMFAAMFREDSPMEPAHLDESGAFMLDLDPDYFAPILNYLRFDKLIVDQALSQQGVLETARFLQLTDVVTALETGSIDTSYLQYVEIAYSSASSLTTVSGSIDLCAKDLTANLGFVRCGDAFQKSGQHSLIVLNTLASKGWSLAFTLPTSVHVMSFRVTPAAPLKMQRHLMLSSLHLSDPLSARRESTAEEIHFKRAEARLANLSPPGSGKKLFP